MSFYLFYIQKKRHGDERKEKKPKNKIPFRNIVFIVDIENDHSTLVKNS
jgi:hypothetical protein